MKQPWDRPLSALLGIVVLAIGLSGCGGGEEFVRASVQGNVTVGGQPLAEGRILFVPDKDIVGVPAAAVIAAGKYEIPKDKGPSIGLNRVEITALRKTGKKEPALDPGGPEIEETEQYIPVEFNRASKLTAEIKDGDNQHNFEVTTGPGAKK